jgi:hypothetical protein
VVGADLHGDVVRCALHRGPTVTHRLSLEYDQGDGRFMCSALQHECGLQWRMLRHTEQRNLCRPGMYARLVVPSGGRERWRQRKHAQLFVAHSAGHLQSGRSTVVRQQSLLPQHQPCLVER